MYKNIDAHQASAQMVSWQTKISDCINQNKDINLGKSSRQFYIFNLLNYVLSLILSNVVNKIEIFHSHLLIIVHLTLSTTCTQVWDICI
jgi:hypothetical protein